MTDKLLIIYKKDGFAIICQDGTDMEFVDKTRTSGISDAKTAVAICVSHGYQCEIV